MCCCATYLLILIYFSLFIGGHTSQVGVTSNYHCNIITLLYQDCKVFHFLNMFFGCGFNKKIPFFIFGNYHLYFECNYWAHCLELFT